MNKKIIAEIAHEKKELAKSIYNVLAKFEKDTGLEVSSIYIERNDIKTLSDRTNATVITNVEPIIEL